jgi:histidyl-tRNA synthetase
MDILGIKETSADAELIAAVIDMMYDLGFVSDDFSVHISSRNLLEELFLFAGIEREKLPQLYALLDKKHKIPPEVFSADLCAIADTTALQDMVFRILDIKTLDDAATIHADSAALKDLSDIFSLLSRYSMQDVIEFDIGIVRGLAYYTGTVFEVFDKKRTLRAIAGGGRYDKLVGLYGGPDTPAVGFAAGDVVLGELLKDKNSIPQQMPRSDVFIVSFDQTNPGYAIETATIIRKAGISCEFALKKTSIGKQMEQANSARCRSVVFVGGSEEQQGKVKIKHMQTGEEATIAKSNLLETLRLFGIAV